MESLATITALSWGLAFLAGGLVFAGKMPIRIGGGATGPYVVALVAFGFHVAGWFDVLGPATAAAMTFGPLFIAIGFAEGIARVNDPSRIREPRPLPSTQVWLAPVAYGLMGLGVGIMVATPAGGLRIPLFVGGAIMLLGALLRTVAQQLASKEATA